MKRRKNIKWMVWIWNFNEDRLKEYDVMPYFLGCYRKLKKEDRPVDLKDVSEWLKSEARCEYWARCEYEMIIHSWPKLNHYEKVDVYGQLKLNWDVFVKYFWDNVIGE